MPETCNSSNNSDKHNYFLNVTIQLRIFSCFYYVSQNVIVNAENLFFFSGDNIHFLKFLFLCLMYNVVCHKICFFAVSLTHIHSFTVFFVVVVYFCLCF